MRAVECFPFLLACLVLLAAYGEALQCYTCMGSNNDDCNRQGSQSCPSHSDACAVVTGPGSGVMKSCSYKSFCSSPRTPGVRVQCCYTNDCNVSGHASKVGGSFSYLLLLLPLLLHMLSN